MNWKSIKFDWNHVRAFLVTAEEGSLSSAAKALGLTQPTLGRQVAALEREFSVVLFEREGRGLKLTPNGLDLLAHARHMGHVANDFSLAASGQSDRLEGSVCITASDVTAAFVLPPIIHKLRREEPGIEIELIASNQTSDLKRREADIAIRAFRPTQTELIAKRITTVHAHLYANSEYLQSIGNPSTPNELKNADFLGFSDMDNLIRSLNESGFPLERKNFPFISESHLTQWEMVKQGVGIGFMIEQIGDAEQRVERVLPDQPPFVAEIWLVAHRELQTSRRIRRVYDFLSEELAPGK